MKQMLHLRKSGVGTSDASVVLIFEDDEGNILDWGEVSYECSEFGEAFAPFYRNEDGKLMQAYDRIEDAENGNYDHSYRDTCGVYVLEDLLNKLPPIIYLNDNGREYLLSLTLQYDDNNDWICFYQMNTNDVVEDGYGKGMFLAKFSKSKTEAAYNLLVDCIENGVFESRILKV